MSSDNAFILVVSGPSGSGKSSIVKRFLEEDRRFDVSISHTTRGARHTEVDGTDYYFVAPERFGEMVKRGEFVEWAEVYGNRYGTSRAEIELIIGSGRNVLLEIDVAGAMNVRSIFGSRTVLVFVVPGSFGELKERLFSRSTDAEEVIMGRIREARKEIERITEYDYVIMNRTGMLDDSVRMLRCICDAEEGRAGRFWESRKNEFWR